VRLTATVAGQLRRGQENKMHTRGCFVAWSLNIEQRLVGNKERPTSHK
jgi:hypothetical protein